MHYLLAVVYGQEVDNVYYYPDAVISYREFTVPTLAACESSLDDICLFLSVTILCQQSYSGQHQYQGSEIYLVAEEKFL